MCQQGCLWLLLLLVAALGAATFFGVHTLLHVFAACFVLTATASLAGAALGFSRTTFAIGLTTGFHTRLGKCTK